MILTKEQNRLFWKKISELKRKGVSPYSINMLVSSHEANGELPALFPNFDDPFLDYDSEINLSLEELLPIIDENAFELSGAANIYLSAHENYRAGEKFEALQKLYKIKFAISRPVNEDFERVINLVFHDLYMKVVNNHFEDEFTINFNKEMKLTRIKR